MVARTYNSGYKPRRRMMRKSRPRYIKPMTPYRVTKIIGAELKRFTTSLNGIAPADLGSIIPLSDLILQGDLATQRSGDWIKPINLHGTVSVKATDSAGQIVTVRCFVFRWNEDASSGPPVLADIVSNTSAPGSQFNFANKGLFKVVYTKVFNLVNQDNNPAYQKLLKLYIKLNKSPKILFNGAFPKKNHLYFGIFADTDAVGETPTFRLDVVLRYTDS